MKLYFQSEPETFNEFKKQIDIEGVMVILDDNTQEFHSQHNNGDEMDRLKYRL